MYLSTVYFWCCTFFSLFVLRDIVSCLRLLCVVIPVSSFPYPLTLLDTGFPVMHSSCASLLQALQLEVKIICCVFVPFEHCSECKRGYSSSTAALGGVASMSAHWQPCLGCYCYCYVFTHFIGWVFHARPIKSFWLCKKRKRKKKSDCSSEKLIMQPTTALQLCFTAFSSNFAQCPYKGEVFFLFFAQIKFAKWQ